MSSIGSMVASMWLPPSLLDTGKVLGRGVARNAGAAVGHAARGGMGTCVRDFFSRACPSLQKPAAVRHLQSVVKQATQEVQETRKQYEIARCHRSQAGFWAMGAVTSAAVGIFMACSQLSSLPLGMVLVFAGLYFGCGLVKDWWLARTLCNDRLRDVGDAERALRVAKKVLADKEVELLTQPALPEGQPRA